MKRKRSITLIEIMIVIVLIGIVASVVGYNLRGGLDKGKEFKTQRGREKLESLLNLVAAEGKQTPKQIVDNQKNVRDALVDSGHLKEKDAELLMKDGHGKNYDYDVDDHGYIVVTTK